MKQILFKATFLAATCAAIGQPHVPVANIDASKSEDHHTFTVAVLNPTDVEQSLRLNVARATMSGKGTLWRLASAESNGQNPAISNAPVESIPGPITLPRFSGNIYELAQVAAATNGQPAARRRGRGGFGSPIELGLDDKPAFPEPPAGFDLRRDNSPHGEVKAIQYDSKTLGTRRQLRVYTPPGYSTDRKYPVLFLLHGLGMDDRQWLGGCHADIIIDNLLAAGEIQPMIMVFPNGDANLTAADSEAGRSSSRNGVGGRFDNWGAPFENDLCRDIIPFIESHYSVYTNSEHRALAGLSMGGGQALNIGLVHPETFAYVGGFSSAPNTREFGGVSPGGKLLPDPDTARKLKLVWIACGSRDGLIRVSQGVHRMLKENAVPHVWHVDSHAHDDPEWSSNLFLFAQHLFK